MRRLARLLARRKAWTILTGATLVVLAVGLYFVLRTSEGFGVSREEVTWAELPQDAADINYYVGNLLDGYTSLSFNTSETSFRAWVDGLEKPDGTLMDQETQFMVQLHVRGRDGGASLATIDIARGLICFWREGGRHVQVAYDLTRGRAYYFAHSY